MDERDLCGVSRVVALSVLRVAGFPRHSSRANAHRAQADLLRSCYFPKGTGSAT